MTPEEMKAYAEARMVGYLAGRTAEREAVADYIEMTTCGQHTLAYLIRNGAHLRTPEATP